MITDGSIVNASEPFVLGLDGDATISIILKLVKLVDYMSKAESIIVKLMFTGEIVSSAVSCVSMWCFDEVVYSELTSPRLSRSINLKEKNSRLASVPLHRTSRISRA